MNFWYNILLQILNSTQLINNMKWLDYKDILFEVKINFNQKIYIIIENLDDFCINQKRKITVAFTWIIVENAKFVKWTICKLNFRYFFYLLIIVTVSFIDSNHSIIRPYDNIKVTVCILRVLLFTHNVNPFLDAMI